jgi:hypothetical protein
LEMFEQMLEHEKSVGILAGIVGEQALEVQWEDAQQFRAQVVAFFVFAWGHDIPST